MAFADYAEPDVRAMVESTAARFYGFDLDLLRPVGDRIGPLVSDVAQPLAPENWPTNTTCNAFDPTQILRAWWSREGSIHDGPARRPSCTQVNREIEAKKADIWSEAVTAVYETDPDIIAAVLPPPLEPGPEPAGPHHHHQGRDARPADLRRRLDRRAGAPRGPPGGVPDPHADDHRAVADRRPRGQRRAQEAGRGRGHPRRRPRLGPHRPHGLGDLRDHGHGERDPRELRAGEDRLLVQAVALLRGGGRARPGSAPRLRREDGADAAARVDRRASSSSRRRRSIRWRTSWCAAWWTSTGRSGPPRRWAGSSGRCRGPGSSRSSTSATTTSRCSGRNDERRPLPDHFRRRPRRPARRGLPALPRRRPTTRSSTSTWPSATPTATSCSR